MLVAIEREVEGAGTPARPPEEPACGIGEDGGVLMALEVMSEEYGEERGQSDGAGAGRGLGRAEPLAPGTFLERADVGVDDDGAVVGVGVVALECGDLAPAAAGPGGGDDEQGTAAVV